LRVFVDFDGTITTRDVGYELFKTMTGGATEDIVAEYRQGRISSLHCLSGECEIWNRRPPDPEDVLKFLDRQTISPGFHDFVSYCETENIDITILSEGFDFYIDRILENNGLDHLPKVTNKAVYDDRLLSPDFPYHKDGCGSCSNCKGHHIRSTARDWTANVFIGDGHSDIHAAESADIVFAKSFLAEKLNAGGRFYYEYTDFTGVLEKLQELRQKAIIHSSRNFHISRDSSGDSKTKFLLLGNDKTKFGSLDIAAPDRFGNCLYELDTGEANISRVISEEILSSLLSIVAVRWPDAGLRAGRPIED